MTKQVLSIPCAEPDAPEQEAREAEIRIVKFFAALHLGTLPEQAEYWDNAAQELCDALYRSLPGALWERLLAKMLAATASYYIRSFEEVGHGKEKS